MREPIEDVEVRKLEEAMKRHNLRIMQTETYRDLFGDCFTELREAITHQDGEDVKEMVDHIERVACNLIEQFDAAYTGI
jgi:hypothetical protein